MVNTASTIGNTFGHPKGACPRGAADCTGCNGNSARAAEADIADLHVPAPVATSHEPDPMLEVIPGHYARDGEEYNRFIDDAYEAKRMFEEERAPDHRPTIELADGSTLSLVTETDGTSRFEIYDGRRTIRYQHADRASAFNQADNLAWTAVLRSRSRA